MDIKWHSLVLSLNIFSIITPLAAILSHQKGNQDAHLILCVWPQTEKLSGPSPNLSALRASPDINLNFFNLPKVESNVSKNQFHASLVLVLTLMGIL